MVDVLPFTGLLYDPERVDDLESVVAPPYDKLSPDDFASRTGSSPHSICHVELGERVGETLDASYDEAARVYESWKEEGIVRPDEGPALYHLRQSFELQGTTWHRDACLGLLRLPPTDDTTRVWPHERTMEAPEDDRLELVRRVRAHPSSIFCLHRDGSPDLRHALVEATRDRPPLRRVVCGDEVHEVRAIRDPGTIGEIQALLARGPALIADGHHRYEAACRFRDETGEDLRLAAFVDSLDPGLVILPAHRLVQTGPDADDSWIELFESEPVGSDPAEVERLVREAYVPGEAPVFAAGFPEGPFHLHRPPVDAAFLGEPAALTHLPAEILRRVVLPRLGVQEDHVEERVAYARRAVDACRRGREEGWDLVFCLPPVAVETVWRVAEAGEVMPPKSTDFYPKLLSGLVIQDLEISR